MTGTTVNRYPDHLLAFACPADVLYAAGVRREGSGWSHEWKVWHDRATMEWVVEYRAIERH